MPEVEDELESELAATYKAQVKSGRLSITGNNAASKLTLRLGATATILEVDVGDDGSAEFSFDRSTFDRITIDASGGNDIVTMNEQSGAFTTEEQVTINGGGGDDTILGGVGPETIYGGSGNDLIAGRYGVDTISLGGGDDKVLWDPGGASDIVEGDNGTDTLIFNLSSANEDVELTANGDRLRLTRNVAAITMDLHALEVVELHPKGGTDRIVVNDLTGTFVTQVNVDLTYVGEGDGLPDSIIINGTTAADIIDVGLDGTAVAATGLDTEVRVTNGEPAFDRLIVNGDAADSVNINGSPAADTMLVIADANGPVYDGGGFNVLVAPSATSKVTVNGLGGDDWIGTSGGVTTPLVLDGGDGNDHLLGGFGPDLLFGGAGVDIVEGQVGPDTARLGEGDDIYMWTPGDSSDVVEGEAGSDTLMFHTSNAGETVELRAKGSRVELFRNIGATTTDLDGIERFEVHTFGGADTIVVNPLTGTSATHVAVDLAAYLGSSTGDAQPDIVVVNGTAGVDTIDVTAEGTAVTATGLGAEVSVTNGEPMLDRMVVSGGALNVNGSPAADTMVIVADASGAALYDGGGFNVLVAPSAVAEVTVKGHGGDDSIGVTGGVVTPLILDGGDGNDQITGGYGADRLLGGAGNDTIKGGAAADTALLGAGDDTYYWTPGDNSDVVDGEAGSDRLLFHASGASDEIEVRANGSRVRLSRNIAATTTDLGDIERIDVATLGGADVVSIGDLTGTPVTQVNVDLASYIGSSTSDGLVDSVTVLGSPVPDSIAITADAGTAVVSGLAATVRLAHPDVSDQLAVHGQGGVDLIMAAGLEALITLMTYQD